MPSHTSGDTDGLRAWIFDGGTFSVPAALMAHGAGDASVAIPTVWAALDHVGGLTLIDTGAAPPEVSGCIERPFSVEEGLRVLGASPDDVLIIINTHLHADHVAGNRACTNAMVVVQRRELTYAANPVDPQMAPEYDGDLIGAGSVEYRAIDGDHDLFGDRSVRLIATPGHSPGHQSVLVRLGSGRQLLFAGDAIWTGQCRDESVTPGLLWSADPYASSRRHLLQLAQRTGAHWVHSHEPSTFAAGGFTQGRPLC